MMQRYFINLAYDGTNYHGWQIQPNGISVEEKLEQALSTLLRQPTDVVGAGRTDASVHARMMVAHFDHEGEIDCQQLAYKLNRFLPRDIVIHHIRPVASDMHARFSARKRQYHYYLHTKKDPWLRFTSYEVHYPLDFNLMNDGAQLLEKHTDFACFCKAGAESKTTLCDVMYARWTQIDESRWVFTIEANRFLRNMVRAIVGTLIDLGRHRISLSDLERMLNGGTRSDAGESVPAHALFLDKIEY